MSDDPYTNREIDGKIALMIEASNSNRATILETVQRNDKDYRESFTRIELQTTQHNHRMSKIERWQLIVATAVAMLIVLKFPELLAVLKLMGV